MMEYTQYLTDSGRYYTQYTYAKTRSYIQPYISTEFTANEVIDRLFISDIASAYNQDQLDKIGITHILVVALGLGPVFPEKYVYKTIPLRDTPDSDIFEYLDGCVSFIDSALKSNKKNKVLVHCMYGVSRSAAVVIAYLIKIKKMCYQDAYNYIKTKRKIARPNSGFELQLMKYQKKTEQDND